MAITRGAFSHLLEGQKTFWDECSRTRHFFAKLGLCKHQGEWLNMKQYFHKVYGTWIVEPDDVSNSVMTKEQIEQVIEWMREAR